MSAGSRATATAAPTVGTAPWLRVAPAVFALAWGGNHFTPLLHVYETVGHYAAWQANLLLGVYVAGIIPGMLVAAVISDRTGRRPVTMAGLLSGAAASVLLGVGMDSFALLCVGRVLAGVGVGVAMSVGSSWIKELTAREPDASATAGARRSTLTLTLGFAVGAGVSGVVAQWAPDPGQLPYLAHLVLCGVAFAALVATPESVSPSPRAMGVWWRDLAVPSAGHRTFWMLVVPAAPWVFAAAGVAYAVMPAAVGDRLGQVATLYATGLTVLTLGVGAAAQFAVGWINRVTGGRALVVGMAGVTAGMALGAVAAFADSPLVAALTAALLGGSYGLCMVAGLIVVQRLATPQDLAGLTGVYYALTYLGFLLPTLLAGVDAPYAVGLGIVAAVSAASLMLVIVALRARSPHRDSIRTRAVPVVSVR